MPSKSRRSRNKQAQRIKKRGGQPSPQVMTAQSPVDIPATEPEVSPRVEKIPAPIKSAVIQYPYIFQELRRIGILSGIMLIILIIVTFILS